MLSVESRILGVQPGDQVEVTVSRLTVMPLGVFPRSKRLTVSGQRVFRHVGDSLGSYLIGNRVP